MTRHPTVPLFDDVMGTPVPTLQTGAEEQRDALAAAVADNRDRARRLMAPEGGELCPRYVDHGCPGRMHATETGGTAFGSVRTCDRCGTVTR